MTECLRHAPENALEVRPPYRFAATEVTSAAQTHRGTGDVRRQPGSCPVRPVPVLSGRATKARLSAAARCAARCLLGGTVGWGAGRTCPYRVCQPQDFPTFPRRLALASRRDRGPIRRIAHASDSVRVVPTDLEVAEARVGRAVPERHRRTECSVRNIGEQCGWSGTAAPPGPDRCRRPCAPRPPKDPQKRGSKPKKPPVFAF